MGRMRSAFISPLDPRLNCGVPWHFTQGLCQTTALFICLTIYDEKYEISLWKSLQDAQDVRMVSQVFDLCPICFPYVSHAPMAAPTRPTGLRFWPSKVYQEVGNGQGAQGTRNPAGISWEWGWQWLTNGWPMAGWKSLCRYGLETPGMTWLQSRGWDANWNGENWEKLCNLVNCYDLGKPWTTSWGGCKWVWEGHFAKMIKDVDMFGFTISFCNFPIPMQSSVTCMLSR